MSRERDDGRPTEADAAQAPDARAGRAMVEARLTRCTPEERAAFWAAVGRCFGGGAPPPPPETGHVEA